MASAVRNHVADGAMAYLQHLFSGAATRQKYFSNYLSSNVNYLLGVVDINKLTQRTMVSE
jgi:hypothetical protein